MGKHVLLVAKDRLNLTVKGHNINRKYDIQVRYFLSNLSRVDFWWLRSRIRISLKNRT